MRTITKLAVLGLAGLLAAARLETAPSAQAAGVCRSGAATLGVARELEIDAADGPLYGQHTKFARDTGLLGPKEVVLTFDDGPSPAVTRPILDTLDDFCTKATFFMVGRMAVASPHLVEEVARRGHTIGSHTWSHPSLQRLGLEPARDEIERGFAAVALAAGRPIAPFFRFPGLGDTAVALDYLKSRGIATFTVDVISNDSFIASTEHLIRTTLDRLEARQGGILLLHDIKPQTARALPEILSQMARRGYRVVHLRPRSAFAPEIAYLPALQAMLARSPRKVLAATPAIEDQGSARSAPMPGQETTPWSTTVRRTHQQSRRTF